MYLARSGRKLSSLCTANCHFSSGRCLVGRSAVAIAYDNSSSEVVWSFYTSPSCRGHRIMTLTGRGLNANSNTDFESTRGLRNVSSQSFEIPGTQQQELVIDRWQYKSQVVPCLPFISRRISSSKRKKTKKEKQKKRKSHRPSYCREKSHQAPVALELLLEAGLILLQTEIYATLAALQPIYGILALVPTRMVGIKSPLEDTLLVLGGLLGVCDHWCPWLTM